MYGIKNILDKSPVTVSGAVVAVVNFCIAMSWLTLDGKQVAALNTALVLLLSLFVANKTANKAVLHELADDGDNKP